MIQIFIFLFDRFRNREKEESENKGFNDHVIQICVDYLNFIY